MNLDSLCNCYSNNEDVEKSNKNECIIYFTSKIDCDKIIGPNWFILIPTQQEIDNYNNIMKIKAKNKEIFRLCKRICSITNISYYSSATNSNVFPLIKIFLQCNYCKKYFEKNLDHLYLYFEDFKFYKNIEAYCSRKCGTDNLNYNYHKKHPEIRKSNIEKLNNNKEAKEKSYQALKEWQENNRDRYLEICKNNGLNNSKKLVQWQKENKEEFSKICKITGTQNIINYNKSEQGKNKSRELGIKYGSKNIKSANEKLKWLRENDHEWVKMMREINKNSLEKAKKYWYEHPEKAKIQRKNALKKANEKRLNIIYEQLSNLNLKILQNNINLNTIFKLKQNDICGAYLIKAKFKYYKDTNREKEIFKILVCKSIHVYDEIYWILRVLSHPEKQNKISNNDNTWTFAKWWYIANLYYDFEFILLTNKDGVSEEEALLTEAKYAIDNNMICNKEQIIKDGYSKNHSYWSL